MTETIPLDPPVRILIVDDVFDNRVVLARRFDRRGYATVQVVWG